jgi:hypothetical protein
MHNVLALPTSVIKSTGELASVAHPDPGLLDPDPLIRGIDPDPDPSIIKQN